MDSFILLMSSFSFHHQAELLRLLRTTYLQLTSSSLEICLRLLSFALRVYGVDEFTDFSSIFRIGTREVLDGSLLGKCLDSSDEVLKSKLEVYLNEWLGIAEMRRNVVTKTEFLILIQDIVEENSDLHINKIIV